MEEGGFKVDRGKRNGESQENEKRYARKRKRFQLTFMWTRMPKSTLDTTGTSWQPQHYKGICSLVIPYIISSTCLNTLNFPHSFIAAFPGRFSLHCQLVEMVMTTFWPNSQNQNESVCSGAAKVEAIVKESGSRCI